MIKPKVTVGVCVRNCEDFIEEAIHSIMNQDFPHELMELIFVDDGSEDNTLSIIKAYISKIEISTRFFHTSWKGLGHARNMVLASAKGNFILWVDGDMILSKNFVRKLVDFMDNHSDTGIAKGKQALECGPNLLATLETFARASSRMVDYESKKSRLKSLGTGGSICRVEVLKEVGGFDECLKGYGEDFDIEIRVRNAGYSLNTVNSSFLDYERRGLTWKNLWRRYWLRGYYSHYFLHKNRGMIKYYGALPPVAFLLGFLHAHKLFKLTYQRFVFLLPFQYGLKMVAWCVGFAKSHCDSYEPR